MAVDGYVLGYTSVIFLRGSRPGLDPRYEEMRRLAEKDAILDGREVLRQAGHPSAGGTDRDVALAFGYLVREEYKAKHNCSGTTAEWHFEQDLRAKAMRKIGAR
jgi:hypothetical protein